MSVVSTVPIERLREAVAAWRAHHDRMGIWWLRPNPSIHDRIDELVDEIERLRKEVGNGQ